MAGAPGMSPGGTGVRRGASEGFTGPASPSPNRPSRGVLVWPSRFAREAPRSRSASAAKRSTRRALPPGDPDPRDRRPTSEGKYLSTSFVKPSNAVRCPRGEVFASAAVRARSRAAGATAAGSRAATASSRRRSSEAIRSRHVRRPPGLRPLGGGGGTGRSGTAPILARPASLGQSGGGEEK